MKPNNLNQEQLVGVSEDISDYPARRMVAVGTAMYVGGMFANSVVQGSEHNVLESLGTHSQAIGIGIILTNAYADYQTNMKKKN